MNSNFFTSELMAAANLPTLSQIKEQAKRFQKKNKGKYKLYLDLSAQSFGFTDYKSAQAMLTDVKK